MDQYDLIIKRGRIIDGSGNPWYVGDVAITKDRIAAVGNLVSVPSKTTIDALDKVICPGFIDLHTHGDLAHLDSPDAAPRVMQGITTDVIGHDGLSYAPGGRPVIDYFRRQIKSINGDPDLSYDWTSVGEFLSQFDGTTSINVAFLLPHGPVRIAGMGTTEDRRPTETEMVKMKSLAEEGMKEGCVGFSTGLTYAPCSYASTDELTELCSVVAKYDVPFMPHLRSYGTEVDSAIQEAVSIAKKSGIPLHLTHYQVVFPVNKHRVDKYLEVIDQTRADGMDTTCDSYCYDAGSTYIRGLLPGWTQSMDADEFAASLNDPKSRKQIRIEVEETGCDGSHGVPIDWSKVQISNVASNESREWIGIRVDRAAKQAGLSSFDFVAELLIANSGDVSCVTFFGYEAALQKVMQHPAHLIGSDAIMIGEKPHPRAWGCHARYLGHYTRELGVLRLEETIRKMTSGPAARLGLSDRGLLKPGMAADITVFDPDTIIDTATFDDPKQHPVGVFYVLVNGQLVVDNGVHTHVRAGKALRRG